MDSSLFFKYFPIVRIVIREKSMEPYFYEGDTVVFLKRIFFKIKIGDVIIFHHPTPPFLFCKRLKKIEGDKIWVEGDNKKESIDSRKFGYINKKDIIGKAIWKL